MAPLPVIGNVVRIACNWTSVGGIAPVNIFHISTGTTDEEEIGEAVAASMVAAGANLWAPLQESYRLNDFTITRLDGTSAGVVYDPTPTIGGQATGTIVGAAAAVLSLRTTQRGPRGRGRLYIGPVGEGVLTDSLIDIGVRTNCIQAWRDFADELSSSTITATLGVASYVHAQFGPAVSISMRPPAGTVRRRQNQLV